MVVGVYWDVCQREFSQGIMDLTMLRRNYVLSC